MSAFERDLASALAASEETFAAEAADRDKAEGAKPSPIRAPGSRKLRAESVAEDRRWARRSAAPRRCC